MSKHIRLFLRKLDILYTLDIIFALERFQTPRHDRLVQIRAHADRARPNPLPRRGLDVAVHEGFFGRERFVFCGVFFFHTAPAGFAVFGHELEEPRGGKGCGDGMEGGRVILWDDGEGEELGLGEDFGGVVAGALGVEGVG